MGCVSSTPTQHKAAEEEQYPECVAGGGWVPASSSLRAGCRQSRRSPVQGLRGAMNGGCIAGRAAPGPGCRDGKKLRTDATLEEVYELGAQIGEGGETSRTHRIAWLRRQRCKRAGLASPPAFVRYASLLLRQRARPSAIWALRPQASPKCGWPRTATRGNSTHARSFHCPSRASG
jgi:hypothetical protein